MLNGDVWKEWEKEEEENKYNRSTKEANLCLQWTRKNQVYYVDNEIETATL